ADGAVLRRQRAVPGGRAPTAAAPPPRTAGGGHDSRAPGLGSGAGAARAEHLPPDRGLAARPRGRLVRTPQGLLRGVVRGDDPPRAGPDPPGVPDHTVIGGAYDAGAGWVGACVAAGRGRGLGRGAGRGTRPCRHGLGGVTPVGGLWLAVPESESESITPTGEPAVPV